MCTDWKVDTVLMSLFVFTATLKGRQDYFPHITEEESQVNSLAQAHKAGR